MSVSESRQRLSPDKASALGASFYLTWIPDGSVSFFIDELDEPAIKTMRSESLVEAGTSLFRALLNQRYYSFSDRIMNIKLEKGG